MMTVEACMKAAWAALLKGDTAGRDRYCDLAKNLMAAGDRKAAGYPAEEIVCQGAPICLPDLGKQRFSQ